MGDFQKLLGHYATKLNARVHRGKTPLIVASMQSRKVIIEKLINVGADINATDSEGMTALHWAVSSEAVDADVVYILLKYKASLTVQDKVGRTPLHCAARFERVDAARKLLDAGADPNMQDNYGATPLIHAIHAKAIGVFRILLQHPAINVNVSMHDGSTPLMYASALAKKNFVEDLLNAGASVNATCNAGWTALHWAADLESLDPDIVDILIKHGAKISAQDDDGETPLHIAAGNGRADIVKKLLCAGADANARDNDGRSLIHTVVEANIGDNDQGPSYSAMKVMIGILVEAGADINAVDYARMTALHMAVTFNEADTVRLLLEHGANVDAQDDCGRTPLFHAAREGLGVICRILLRNFADRFIPDHRNRFPKDAAGEGLYQDIVMQLVNEYMPAG